MPTDWKGWIPWAIGAGAAVVAGLFAMFRADNIRAGETYPTKLAVAQTYSAIAGFFRLKRKVRASDVAPEPIREFRSVEEMKATITPGTLRAEDIPALPTSRRSPAKSDAVDR